MLNWLKFTFGSFTSNKLAKEAISRKVWNVVFALLLTLIILTALFSTGINYSVGTHYSSASKFKDFAYSAFKVTTEENNSSVNLQIVNSENGDYNIKAFYGTNPDNMVIINTFDNESDKALYSKNDYNLIIDTRPSETTYVDFKITVYDKNQKAMDFDNDGEITNNDYLLFLNYENQSDYSCVIETFTDVIINPKDNYEGYYDYIENTYIKELEEKYEKDNKKDTLKELENEKAAWNKIKELDNESDEYFNEVYNHYAQVRYRLAMAPTLLYHYQSMLSETDKDGEYVKNKFLVLTDSWAMVSFTNDKGVTMVYDGYYSSMSKDFTLYRSESDKVSIANNVDLLVLSIYSSVNSLRSLVLGMQLFRYFPTIIIVLAVIALFLFCLGRIKRNLFEITYGGSFKVASSFLIGSATISGILTLIFAFIYNNQVAISIGIWSLLSIISIRSFIYAIVEIIRAKKNKGNVELVEEAKNVEAIVKDNGEGNSHIDLSKVDTGTRIITNENVDDDDEGKMELM